MDRINLIFLREYSTIQQNLLEVIASRYVFDKFLQSVPKSGEIYINFESWTYEKHGAGIRFSNKVTDVIVDAHTIRKEMMGAFDAWRILIYAESLGLRDLDEKKVNSTLVKLREKGLLTALNEGEFFISES